METIELSREYQTNTGGSVLLLQCPSTGCFRTGWNAPHFGYEDESGYHFDDTVSEQEAIENWTECLMRSGNSGYGRRTRDEAVEIAKADVAKARAFIVAGF